MFPPTNVVNGIGTSYELTEFTKKCPCYGVGKHRIQVVKVSVALTGNTATQQRQGME